MSVAVVLEKFWFEELSIQWRPVSRDEGSERPTVAMELLLSYETTPDARTPERARVLMTLSTASETPAKVGYEIHCQAAGIFVADASEMAADETGGRAFQIQAVTILYGILRRQVAEATETFPGKGLQLPEVSAELLVDRLANATSPQQSHFESPAAPSRRQE